MNRTFRAGLLAGIGPVAALLVVNAVVSRRNTRQLNEKRPTAFTVTVPLGSAHLPPDRVGADSEPASTGTGAAPYVEEALRWLPDGRPAEDDPWADPPGHNEPMPAASPQPD